MEDKALILLIIIPFSAGAACLANRFFPRLILAPWLSTSAMLANLCILIFLFGPIKAGVTVSYSLGGWPDPVGIGLSMDGMAWLSSFFGQLVAFCALLFATGEKKGNRYDFYFFFLMLLAGMQGVILTADIFNMFVFLEILSIASYILIARSEENSAPFAAFKYLLLSSAGIAFFLLGILLVYQSIGTLSLEKIKEWTGGMLPKSPGLIFALACLLAGAGLKAAFFPIHTWLPDAHASAPHPVSAVLSGVMIKISFLAVWRIIGAFHGGFLNETFVWIGGFTAVFGAIMALSQTDVKRILAYHSVSQMGLIVGSFGTGSPIGMAASVYHIISHSLFKSLLFLTVGAKIAVSGNRDLLIKKTSDSFNPFLFFTFVAGALSISGVPPFNGYASKALISMAFKDRPEIYWAFRVVGVFTAASFFKLSGFFRSNTAEKRNSRQKIKLSLRTVLPILLLAIFCFATGIAPVGIFRMISGMLGVSFPDAPVSFFTKFSIGVSLFSVALGFGLYQLTRTGAGGKTMLFLRSRSLGINGSLTLLVLFIVTLTTLSWVSTGLLSWKFG